MRFSQQVLYPIVGFLLGAGAPVGCFLVRFASNDAVRRRPSADLRRHQFFYVYELLATSLVFGVAGCLAGRRADRLRQGRAFYLELAEHDALTGLHNQRAFVERYRRALERAVSTGQPLAVLLIDVDQLKAINDAFGHAAGNQVLIHVAEALRSGKRTTDLAARWGGDEFAILLEGADASAAQRVAEAVMERLHETALLPGPDADPVTVTIGISAAAPPSSSSDLFEVADRALLAGKARGRNTIQLIANETITMT